MLRQKKKLSLKINLKTFQRAEPLKSEKLVARLLSPPEGTNGGPLAAHSIQRGFCLTKPKRKANNMLASTPHQSFRAKGRRPPTSCTWTS